MASDTSTDLLQAIYLVQFSNTRPGNHFIHASLNAALEHLLHRFWRRSNRFYDVFRGWSQEAIIIADIDRRPLCRVGTKAIIEGGHKARLAGAACCLPGFLS